eukprot:c24489_g1_i1 orf=407-2140(-)
MGLALMKKKQSDGDADVCDPSLGCRRKFPASRNGSWAEHPATGGSRKITAVICCAAACFCAYAVMLVFSGHPCSWHFFHCASMDCNNKAVSSPRGESGAIHESAPGSVTRSSEIESTRRRPPAQKMGALAGSLESTLMDPINLPIGHALAANPSMPTNLSNIVFGIAASARLWVKRKEYIKLWWRPGEMRGFVWLDRSTGEKGWDKSLPQWKISGNTDHFSYTNQKGRSSAIRISRIVSETFRLGLKNVHWFVMGDDDTIFIPENLVTVLSKYDHKQYYYIGSSSESHPQNLQFSYNMAYGGGGFAISYPLAKALERMQDACIQRYPALYGSDDRMQACMAELGVPLTRESGFHQYDVYGNLYGLMAAHPVTPVLSFHHLDVVDPIFPNRSRLEALQHLSKSIKLDPAGFLQQSICYDKAKQWSISVSWGFAVEVYRGIISPRELEMPSRTFFNWYRKADYTGFSFNTRAVSRHPCQKPIVYYMNEMRYSDSGGTELEMNSSRGGGGECRWAMASPTQISWIKVVKAPDLHMWTKAPRRKCCSVVPSTFNATSMEITVKDCTLEEAALLSMRSLPLI